MSDGTMDAQRFLAFNERLKLARERIGDANVHGEKRAGWQRRLIAISNGATENMQKAEAQLERLEAELERHG